MTVFLGFCIYHYSIFRGFEPVAFKMVKMKIFKYFYSRFELVSSRVDIQDTTTELQDNIKNSSNTTYIIKT